MVIAAAGSPIVLIELFLSAVFDTDALKASIVITLAISLFLALVSLLLLAIEILMDD
jgi:hypothetical protein